MQEDGCPLTIAAYPFSSFPVPPTPPPPPQPPLELAVLRSPMSFLQARARRSEGNWTSKRATIDRLPGISNSRRPGHAVDESSAFGGERRHLQKILQSTLPSPFLNVGRWTLSQRSTSFPYESRRPLFRCSMSVALIFR